MPESRFRGAQLIGILDRTEGGTKVRDFARGRGVSKGTIYQSLAKDCGLEINGATRLMEPEGENRRLTQMVAGLSLDSQAL